MSQITSKFRIVFFLFNVLYLCIGAVMLAIGLYSILSLQQYGFFTQNMYTPPAAIFVAVGAVKIVFGFIGLVAMCLKKSPIFAIYISVLIFLMLATFFAAIYGFLQRPAVYNTTLQRLDWAFQNYATYNSDIAAVQTDFNCCGYNSTYGARDYEAVGQPVLGNCSGVPDGNPRNTVFIQGCAPYLTQGIQFYLYLIGAMGMAFGTTELTSFLIAMQNLEGLV